MSTSSSMKRIMSEINKEMREKIGVLSKEYGFGYEEALRKVDLRVEIPLPFDAHRVNPLGCSGLTYNGGLFTQCEGNVKLEKEEGELYCKSCEKEIEKLGNLECGTIRDRVKAGFQEYKDNRGRSEVSYLKVLEKNKISRMEAEAEAGLLNYMIEECNFVGKEKVGRPKALKKKKEKALVVEDLFARLASGSGSESGSSSETETDAVVAESDENDKKLVEKDKKKAENDQKLVEKEEKMAAQKALKEEKEQKLAAEKELKEQKLAAEKELKDQKLAEKLAEKELKDQKLAAEKALKDEKLAAEKELKDQKLAEKDQKLAAEKELKDQKLAAEKELKDQKMAEKLAEKELKDQKLATEKALKEEKLATEKALKATEKAFYSKKPVVKEKKVEEKKVKVKEVKEKKVEKVEEEEKPVSVKVTRITINGVLYMRASDNLLYNPETKEAEGIYDPETQTIKELPEDDDEEEEIEEDGYDA